MFDLISQLFTSYKLTIKLIIGGVIMSILVFSVRGCIQKDSIIATKDTIIATKDTHIELQAKVITTSTETTKKAIQNNKIIAEKKAKIEKEVINFELPALTHKINDIFTNFNNTEYDS